MKKIFLLLAISLFACFYSFAQTPPYNVVFDMTSKDTLVQKILISWLTDIPKGEPNAKLEVVFYAKSLDMVTLGKSAYATQIKDYFSNAISLR